MTNQIYFALWAEDIGKYLSVAYNSTSINGLKKELLSYVSMDTDNPKGVETFSLLQLLGMTGLNLDFRCSPFPFRNEIYEDPTAQRVGKKVHNAFIS